MSVFFPDEGLCFSFSSVYAALMAFGKRHIQNELHFAKAARHEATLIIIDIFKIVGCYPDLFIIIIIIVFRKRNLFK